MVKHILGTDELQVRFLLGAPTAPWLEWLRQRIANPFYVGSNPIGASITLLHYFEIMAYTSSPHYYSNKYRMG